MGKVDENVPPHQQILHRYWKANHIFLTRIWSFQLLLNLLPREKSHQIAWYPLSCSGRNIKCSHRYHSWSIFQQIVLEIWGVETKRSSALVHLSWTSGVVEVGLNQERQIFWKHISTNCNWDKGARLFDKNTPQSVLLTSQFWWTTQWRKNRLLIAERT